MRIKKPSISLTSVLVILTVDLFAPGTYAAAQQEIVLHSFGVDSKDGTVPYASLVFDAVGNLYGTTSAGGAYGNGTVFEMMPISGASWTETLLYTFRDGKDGHFPYAGLIFDRSGNLYGTTSRGGANLDGTVFELTPLAGGGWTEKVVQVFGNGNLGAYLYAGVTFDATGKLYCATKAGGQHGVGIVFQLSYIAGGWFEKVLHNFNNNTQDGAGSYGGLVFDAAGNLYGSTKYGGPFGQGVVFEMSHKAGAGWTEKTLHGFSSTGKDGAYPSAGLILDVIGNLYSTTSGGGAYGAGTVFELAPAAGGGWTETILYDFGNGTDGAYPYASLVLDAAGNLYGTTSGGGAYGAGTVFELTPTAGGAWTETILHDFGTGTDGAYPYAGLIFDALGNLYGTTSGGGTYGYGTVFEITP